MDDILELETRRKIFTLLKKNPGINLSKIAKILNLRVSLVEYHLRYLEKHDMVQSDTHTGFKRYIVTGEVKSIQKKNFSLLRQKNLLIIVLFLIKKGKANHKQILQQMDISPATLSYHLNRLIKNKIIDVDKQGTSHIYKIIDSNELIAWLIEYKPYNLLDGFNDIWVDFTF
jgi:predicted transcriptional regulator